MKLLIFLGNPGPQYEHTRHNIGFLIGDEFTKRANASWAIDKKSNALVAKIKISSLLKGGVGGHDEDILLVKPQTYMNLSGQTVSFLKSFYKLELKDIILIHDDIDLPSGSIKYKFGGSSGGQNGVKDTIAKLGTDQFARIKIGIDRPSHPSMPVADYVLSKLSKEEMEKIPNYTDEVEKKLSHHFFDK